MEHLENFFLCARASREAVGDPQEEPYAGVRLDVVATSVRFACSCFFSELSRRGIGFSNFLAALSLIGFTELLPQRKIGFRYI